MARAKEPRPGEWKYTVGDLTAYERTDRGNAIWTRVYAGAGRYRDKKPLHAGIRDERGKIVPELELEARQATLERAQAASAGIEDLGAPDATLTLTQGFRRVLHPTDGKYAGDTRWRDDVERQLAVVAEALEGDLRFAQLVSAHYRKLWRWMANEHARTGRFGLRFAEQVVGALASATRWLLQEEVIEEGGLPAPGWQEKMRAEWANITDKPAGRKQKLRHTAAEKGALWAHLYDAQIDPRLSLSVEIGAELRLGQVARTRRTDVRPYNGFRFGAVEVHGRGKKLGELVVLTMAQRHALTRAITSGYLADLEAAHQAGEVEDYYLFPHGRLRTVVGPRGRRVRRAQVKNAGAHLERTHLRKLWHDLEDAAGVPNVKGRGWYGMRRRQSDDAEDVVKDERVLNRLGGWANSETRRRYQAEDRPELLDATRDARAAIRPKTKRAKDLPAKSEEV